MSNILEKPIEITKTFNIATFNYSIIDVTLFKSATIVLRFVDEFGTLQKQTEYKIRGFCQIVEEMGAKSIKITFKKK